MSEHDGGWNLMKKEEEWSFEEMQIHAKGYLRGFVIGMCMTILLIGVGIDIYILLKM